MSEQHEPYILILGGEFPLRERVLAGALRAGNGFRVFTLAKARTSNTIKFFDGFIAGDVSDPEGVLSAVLLFEREHGARPAAVIPMNDFTVRSALEVSRHYGLNYNSAETVNRCRDKYLMKQVLAGAGLPVPRFGAFRTLDELKELAREFGMPVVIKPRELAGSVGVIKVTSFDALASAFEQCVADVKALNGAYMTPEDVFVVEEYISSRNEVSVEVFNQGDVHRVIAVTDKYLGPEPYFVETGHSVPSVHSDNEKLRDVAERACEALGIRYGIAHFEARITEAGEVRIIEVGARTGGDAIMDLVERSYGINPYQLHVASYLGIPVNLPEKLPSRGLAAISFLKAQEGVIAHVKSPKELPEIVVNMQITAKPLDVSEKPLSWRAREGSVEFFWKGREPEQRFSDHLRFAQRLSQEIFSVRQPGG
ncbi:ATP-grasp domain-containing protein [Caballeronia sp. BCC1704]|uniref:ATP-grasp domain-containing protein n=1 Tax=Caballeronia sp. BCC1704 TaxID=2676300 RepID=UPI00158A99BD|nr:ATP-grasp domain-containing protein [Caballeronia sp. BCC1704]